ncbi:hypothetical protein FOA52_010165 [Chlamydomonas sp. UWO 241]|nr:hypothetical protein FOA52_010165 [Chlamydomonas sp. UWO 241]
MATALSGRGSMVTRGGALRAPARAQSLTPRPTRAFVARAELATNAKVDTAVVSLNDRDHFRTVLAEAHAANEVLVVDYFTTWCGPCKLIAPAVEEMAAELAGKGVRIAKVTCDATPENKRWALDVQIRTLPTFRLYKGGVEEHVAVMTGTKMAALRAIIEEHRG